MMTYKVVNSDLALAYIVDCQLATVAKFGREFGLEFGLEFGREFGREFGLGFGQEFGQEFGRKTFKIINN